MISIIIPVFNEEDQIRDLVTYLKKYSTHEQTEIIVVDGGSTDKTVEKSKAAGARVVQSPNKGRAHQMNYGVGQATGKWLYFLHADTYPPKTFIKDIREEIERGIQAGCFRLSFDYDHPVLNFYSWFTRFDIDLFRFGDQSLFVQKNLFNKINGFDADLLVMEDQKIVKELKKHAQFSIIEKSVITSARKYRRFGVFRLQLIFCIVIVLFYLKISQEVIVNFYENFLRDV
ncbi:TIGR04283 family arsenosugar biosynthesis glycosyltransferase [Gracilimonas sp.]|uniref:TIGR04283 family arsenosugar biosynthesis glycosyltransferase n=1 Tax=Gracilimonas sp. TaxID=1974203 RepID=UPI00287216EB|nr:TIGR04283 family arsenosugar biosynthesis glycosyltransferase [Gracilimonas sp.]